MKKITTVALASLFSTSILLASSNVHAFGNSWHSGHSFQTASYNPVDWWDSIFNNNNNFNRAGGISKNAPAPIPGLLALAAAVGGGIMIRRKARKNKSDD